jgi:hypothetical protein
VELDAGADRAGQEGALAPVAADELAEDLIGDDLAGGAAGAAGERHGAVLTGPGEVRG